LQLNCESDFSRYVDSSHFEGFPSPDFFVLKKNTEPQLGNQNIPTDGILLIWTRKTFFFSTNQFGGLEPVLTEAELLIQQGENAFNIVTNDSEFW